MDQPRKLAAAAGDCHKVTPGRTAWRFNNHPGGSEKDEKGYYYCIEIIQGGVAREGGGKGYSSCSDQERNYLPRPQEKPYIRFLEQRMGAAIFYEGAKRYQPGCSVKGHINFMESHLVRLFFGINQYSECLGRIGTVFRLLSALMGKVSLYSFHGQACF